MTLEEFYKATEDMPMDKEISLLITDIDGYTIPYTNLRICLVSGEWIKLIET